VNRRTILFASALLLTAGVSTASAQTALVPRVTIGVLAGANFAKLTGDDASGFDSRTGFVGGLSADFHLGHHLGLEVDGLYSQEGASASDPDGTLKLDYIRVPVLLRYSFPTHTSVRPFVTVGPSLGFKASCKLSSGGDSVNCSDVEGMDVKSFDFAGTVGAGLGFKVGKQELSVQGRFNKGFTKVIDGSDAKNQNFALMAGFTF
jgi:opacity protein-like surface antigen